MRFEQLVLPGVDAALIFGIFAAMQSQPAHLSLRKRYSGLAVMSVDFTALSTCSGDGEPKVIQ